MRVAIVLILSLAILPAQPPQRSFNIVEATIDDVRAALASKQITCRALVEQYIRRIEAYDKSGPTLNTVQTINRRAVEEAARLDALPAPAGPLHCVPVLMKDQVETSDMPMSIGTNQPLKSSSWRYRSTKAA